MNILKSVSHGVIKGCKIFFLKNEITLDKIYIDYILARLVFLGVSADFSYQVFDLMFTK